MLLYRISFPCVSGQSFLYGDFHCDKLGGPWEGFLDWTPNDVTLFMHLQCSCNCGTCVLVWSSLSMKLVWEEWNHVVPFVLQWDKNKWLAIHVFMAWVTMHFITVWRSPVLEVVIVFCSLLWQGDYKIRTLCQQAFWCSHVWEWSGKFIYGRVEGQHD